MHATHLDTETGFDPKYRIGTVSHLTGLSADAIRAWERRYEVVSPVRSPGGTRLYSEEDVGRLQLMKALTDCGEPIGAIAHLSSEDLRGRLAKLAGLSSNGGTPPYVSALESRKVTLAVLDPLLARQMEMSTGDLLNLDLVQSDADFSSYLRQLEASKPDVLVLRLDLLGKDPVRSLEAALATSGARMAVVIYEFAPRKRLARLADRGARLLKGPVGVALLRRALLDFLVIREAEIARGDAPTPPRPVLVEGPAEKRRFSDEQLARLREIRSSVDCECPNHLADIVSSLLAFERYSETCEVDNTDDAAFHAELARGTSHARSIVEQLLVRLCEHDHIRL